MMVDRTAELQMVHCAPVQASSCPPFTCCEPEIYRYPAVLLFLQMRPPHLHAESANSAHVNREGESSARALFVP
jgi:hypothetical protein